MRNGARMNRDRTLLPVLCFAGAVACGTEPSPVVVGQVSSLEQGLLPSAEIDIEINGDPRVIPVDRDETFTVHELPLGELRFTAEVEGIKGTMEVYDVLPGEVIEVGVEAGPGSLEMRVVRRDPWSPEVDVLPNRGPVYIHSDHVVHHLEPGEYDGDIVITGDHVTLVGPDYYGCRRGGRAIVKGDLIVDADHVRIVNVHVEGRTAIHGDHVRVFRSCDLVEWDD